MVENKLVKTLKNTNWDIANANASFFLCDLVFEAYANFDMFGINLEPVCCYLEFKKNDEKSNFYQITNEEKLKAIMVEVYNRYSEDSEIVNNLVADGHKITDKFDQLYDDYLKKRNKMTPEEILPIFLESVRLSRDWWLLGCYGEEKGQVIEQTVAPKFAKRRKIPLGKAIEILSILSHPQEQAVFNLERIEFLKICLAAIANKNIDDLISKYIKNYFWIKTDFYCAEELDKKMIRQWMADETSAKSKEEIEQELQKIDKNFSSIKRKKKKLLASIKLLLEDKKDVEFSREVVYWIDQRKLIMMRQFFYNHRLLVKIAEMKKISYHDLTLYRVSEVEKLLSDDKRLSDQELSNRKNGLFAVFRKKGKFEIYHKNEAREMLSFALHVNNNEKIKGVVASTAGMKKVEGKVRIIHHPQKEKFAEGEILVTSMTRIEFVPLMRKAKAIITNEGGMACHAAIVSRELGIPAIIGTKNATQVLKNGDEIEMDLEKGTVKIIKNK